MGERRVIKSERVMLPVEPAWMRGNPDRVYVMSCVKCGAVVTDVVLHDDWHNAIEGMLK